MNTETRELHGQEAIEALAEGLELVPIEPDEFSERLKRAGFSVGKSMRSADRAEQKEVMS